MPCFIAYPVCVCLLQHFNDAGVYDGESSPVLRRSVNILPLTPMSGEEEAYFAAVSLVNLEFDCAIAAVDKKGVRTSEWSSTVRVEPLFTSPPSEWV